MSKRGEIVDLNFEVHVEGCIIYSIIVMSSKFYRFHRNLTEILELNFIAMLKLIMTKMVTSIRGID